MPNKSRTILISNVKFLFHVFQMRNAFENLLSDRDLLLSLIFLHFCPVFSLHALDSAKLLDRGKHSGCKLHLRTEEACDKCTEGWKVCLFWWNSLVDYLHNNHRKSFPVVQNVIFSQAGGNYFGNWCHQACRRGIWKDRWSFSIHWG